MPDSAQLMVFLAAGLVLNLTPGPDVMFIVAHAVRAGARAGVAAALGIAAGCLVHVAAAALGWRFASSYRAVTVPAAVRPGDVVCFAEEAGATE